MFSVEKGDTSGENYCFAVDVGTTTLVVYLLDALNGRQIAVLSEQNRQGICGADVISRISHTIEHPEGLCELKEIVNIQIHRMMKELVVQNSIPCDRIYNCLITGNTTMMHLMVGIDPISIARSPYIPVLTQKLTFSVDNPIFTDFIHCTVTLLPSLSAYIGADILCGVLANWFMEREGAVFTGRYRKLMVKLFSATARGSAAVLQLLDPLSKEHISDVVQVV